MTELPEAMVERASAAILEHEDMFLALEGFDAPDLAPAARATLEAAGVGELLTAIQTAESWLIRWGSHVGGCRGDDCCTCGLVAVRTEATGAISRAEGRADD